MSAEITSGFPHPTPLLEHAFADLQIARTGDEHARTGLGPLYGLARPWDPPSCPPLLRTELWAWLDRVVGWLNHDYSWQAERVIPACWPAHPHLVHELAVLACLRLSAGHALTAEALEDWHRYALPGFFDRMLARLGGSPCQPGSHKPWPGAGRVTDYESPDAVTRRSAVFEADVNTRNHNAPVPRSGGERLRPAGLRMAIPDDPGAGEHVR